MRKKDLIAISSLISIFTALVIDVLVIPGDLNMVTVLGSFLPATATSVNVSTFVNNITGLLYYLIIFAITDTFTALIIASLKSIQRTIR